MSDGWISVPKKEKKKKEKKANLQNPHAHVVPTTPASNGPQYAKTIPCRYFSSGYCHRGNSCYFLHSTKPQRPKSSPSSKSSSKHHHHPSGSPTISSPSPPPVNNCETKQAVDQKSNRETLHSKKTSPKVEHTASCSRSPKQLKKPAPIGSPSSAPFVEPIVLPPPARSPPPFSPSPALAASPPPILLHANGMTNVLPFSLDQLSLEHKDRLSPPQPHIQVQHARQDLVQPFSGMCFASAEDQILPMSKSPSTHSFVGDHNIQDTILLQGSTSVETSPALASISALDDTAEALSPKEILQQNGEENSFFSSPSYFFGAPGTDMMQLEPTFYDLGPVDLSYHPVDQCIQIAENDSHEPQQVQPSTHHDSNGFGPLHQLQSEQENLIKPHKDSHVNGMSYSEVLKIHGHDSLANGEIENIKHRPMESHQLLIVEEEKDPEICPFFLKGNCRYGEHCRNKHVFGKSECPHCLQDVSDDTQEQQKHIEICPEAKLLQKEYENSIGQKCGICYDEILANGRKFGLLSDCEHPFCLDCIREWRGSIDQSRSVVRSCPVCRTQSHFIIPCDRLVISRERKMEVVEKYKVKLNGIPCKYYQRAENCPFGTSCFYAHFNKDGSREVPQKLRHRVNANDEVEIVKSVRLSEFLFR